MLQCELAAKKVACVNVVQDILLALLCGLLAQRHQRLKGAGLGQVAQ